MTETLDEELISTPRAAAVLGYSPRTLADARTLKRLGLTAYRVGGAGALRFRKRDVQRLVTLAAPESRGANA